MRPRARRLAILLAATASCSGACTLGRALWSAPDLPHEAERSTVRTRDGWDLSLVRYPPGKPAPGRRPVLVVHGIVTNQRNVDYDARHSLVRSLSRAGLDAWSVSLRGHGDSTKASLLGGDKKYDWDFDTYCTEDLPAAIAEVRARTGAAQLDYVGHSMGGMLLYCLLARGGEPAASLGAAATMGSPVGFRWGPRFDQLARLGAAAAGKLPAVKLDSPTLLALPVMTWFPEPAALILYNPANVDPRVWSGFLSVGVDDDSPALAAQFGRWIETDRFTSRDGAIDYEAQLSQARTPVMVIAGKVDQLGFPPLVRRGHDALGGPRRWYLAAEENGASADYGHMDLLLGERAEADVFRPLQEWLAERAAPATGAPARR